MIQQRQFEFSNTVTEVEISYKRKQAFCDMKGVNSSENAVNYLRECWTDTLDYKESFYVILLNQANKILGYSKISEGGMTGTVVDISIILEAAILSHSKSVIIAHNHPSGNTTPSTEDKNITEKLKQALLLMDKNLLDHIILTSDSYLSFADEGLI